MSYPLFYLGAPAPGGLALPDAHPSAQHMYAPRGVYFDQDICIVADSGNHRVLIWHQLPEFSGQPADVVLGQPDFYSEGPRAGGADTHRGMHLPTGVAVINGQLWVADAWHHRLMVWEKVPQESFIPPDFIIGQPDSQSIEPNAGALLGAACFYWPYAFGWINEVFYVADTGNRRVLGWLGLPVPGQPADFVIGQSSFSEGRENRGRGVGPNTFRWPHGIAGNQDCLLVADAGNHRVLIWRPPAIEDSPAIAVLGQPDLYQAFELPHVPQGPHRLRFPYALSLGEQKLAVADTANNRVLLWHQPAQLHTFAPADEVLGQDDFSASGENRWKEVALDTLCWPYGVHVHDNRLAVADSGNNRVVFWKLTEDVEKQMISIEKSN